MHVRHIPNTSTDVARMLNHTIPFMTLSVGAMPSRSKPEYRRRELGGYWNFT
jgi:hypothetical protein